MKSLRAIAIIALVGLLATSLYGWWATEPTARPTGRSRVLAEQAPPLVDSSALDAANKLRSLAGTAEEQRLAEDAVNAADHLLDLAFAAALREATEHPPPPNAAMRAAQVRLDAAAQQLVADNFEVQRLTEATGKRKGKGRGNQEAEAEGEVALAQSKFEVDQYEFGQAGNALVDAGGDMRGRIQSLVAEHQAASPKAAVPIADVATKPGLVNLGTRWLALHRKEIALTVARAQVADALASLAAARDSAAQRIAAQRARASGAAAGREGGAPARDVSAELLATTQQIAADHKALASIDERRSAEQQLAKVYDEWLAVVARQTTAALHGILSAIATIAGVCLVLLFFGSWLEAAFGRLRLDRRQVETLRTVTTVVLQVAAVLFILLVIFGPPGQLGTFLGLAGAGLTVALKDFIVAFIGWLVLMGKNGIRLGDWVEIDGVAGEVVELGMFHTVLLETGNWTDSGHPTGRRVTFTNSFAIQGYYFNFSTSGQWLWDELQLVVPAGQDLYAVVDAISKKIQEATAENARLAEDEWRRAAPTRTVTAVSAAPAINVKPVVGGTEILLRYIAKASDRYQLRASLYQAAVDLLAQKPTDATR